MSRSFFFKSAGALTALWCVLATPAHAITITSVQAPNLMRPTDGLLYDFEIVVSGIYDGIDIRLGLGTSFDAEYWDDDTFPNPDDPIDKHAANGPGALTIPAPGGGDVAGSAWAPITLTFKVGCKVIPEVFGPSGATGESPMNDGYFHFTGVGKPDWGYNTVTCVTAVPVPINPPTPYPTLTPVPEPGIAVLLGGGALGLFLRRRSLLRAPTRS